MPYRSHDDGCVLGSALNEHRHHQCCISDGAFVAGGVSADPLSVHGHEWRPEP
jgi:hypothetical protein